MTQQGLMLGDRVMYNGEPSVIVEMHRTCAQVEPSFELVEYGDIQPISLTAEMLVKNFETKIKNVFKVKGYRIQKNDELGDDSFYFGYYRRVFCPICKIDYFHQLQHALRLVGLDDLADSLRP